MFEAIKKAMRMSGNALDDEIKDNIETALLDMSRVGVVIEDAENPDRLVKKCVEFYCKAEMNYLDKSDEFKKRYEKLRDALSLCAKYNGGDADNG